MSDDPITIVLAVTESKDDVYELRLGGTIGPLHDAVQTLFAGGRQWLLSRVEEVGPQGTIELTFLGTKPAAPVLVVGAAHQESSDAAQSRRRSRRHPPRPGQGPSGTAA
jgi:hypothetical protein